MWPPNPNAPWLSWREAGSLGYCEAIPLPSIGMQCGRPGMAVFEHAMGRLRLRCLCPDCGLLESLCLVHEDCKSNQQLASACIQQQWQAAQARRSAATPPSSA